MIATVYNVEIPVRLVQDLAHWIADTAVSKIVVNKHDDNIKVECTAYTAFKVNTDFPLNQL